MNKQGKQTRKALRETDEKYPEIPKVIDVKSVKWPQLADPEPWKRIALRVTFRPPNHLDRSDKR
jgi:hypothetical protein